MVRGKFYKIKIYCIISLFIVINLFFAPSTFAIEQAIAQWSSYMYLTSYTSSTPNYCGGTMAQAGAFITNTGDGTNACAVQNITIYADNVGSSGGWQVSTNDYLEYVFTVYNTGNNNSSDGYFSDARAVSNTIGLTIVDLEYQNLTPSTGLIKIIVKPNSSGTLGAYTTFQNVDIGLRSVDVFKATRLTKWNIYQAGDNTAVVNAILSQKSTIDEILVQLNWNNSLTDSQRSLLQQIINQSTSTASEVASLNNTFDTEKENNQQQGEQSQTDADISEQQVEGATQNILSVIGDFFGAFLSATSTNCVFNWGMAEYGFGDIDFCSIQIPAVFSVILSIVSILIIVPMVLWLFSSIIKAFKEFQE